MATINPTSFLLAYVRACVAEVQYVEQYLDYDERCKEEWRLESHSCAESMMLCEEYLKRRPRVLRELVWTVQRLSEMFPAKPILVQLFPDHPDKRDPEKGRTVRVGFEDANLSAQQRKLFEENSRQWKAVHYRSGRKLKVGFQFRIAEAKHTRP